MRIGAAGDHAIALVDHALGQRTRIRHHLLLIGDEFRPHGFEETNGLGGDHVLKGSTLHAGEDGFVDGRAVLRLGEDHAGAGAPQRLVRGGGDDVGPLAGVGMNARGDKPGKVRHVDQQESAHRIGNPAEAWEIENTRIGAAAGDDQLGLMLLGQAREFVVIDALVVFAHAVRNHFVRLAGEIQMVAVSQVAAVRQVEAQDGVTGLQHRRIGRLIGLRSGMGLHVNVLGAEQFFGPVARQIFNDIDELAAAVIALAGVALGVLVGQDAASGFEHGFGSEIFARDQFQLRALALCLMTDGVVNFGVHFGQRPRHRIVHRKTRL